MGVGEEKEKADSEPTQMRRVRKDNGAVIQIQRGVRVLAS